VKEQHVKLLWGRAAAHCTICRRELTQDAATASGSYPLGEQAHIVGERKGSARYDGGALTPEQRDGYTNRILLCPNDHTVVDKDPATWTVARLHMAKAEHELWVAQTVTTEETIRDQANSLIYSNLMDAATEDLALPEFSNWASSILEPYWRWSGPVFDGVERFRRRVFVADWPGTLPGLEVALDRASFELQEAAALFTQHSELDDEDLIARRWYKQTFHPRHVYEQLSTEFQVWSDTLDARMMEAARALNWAREVWRAEVNPMWLATEGWFSFHLHADMSGRYGFAKPQYTPQQKAALLKAGVGKGDIRAPRVR
jgi:hypothetical protein